MSRRAAPHRGTDVHYGQAEQDQAFEDSGPSKTQLKQQSHALQTLGVALSELSNERFAAIDMPEILRDAITMFRKTRSHEGRRRQMQYVGKLMLTKTVCAKPWPRPPLAPPSKRWPCIKPKAGGPS
jgi:ribosome-associated protein